MSKWPGDDHFRPDWLVLALRALLADRAVAGATVGVAVDGRLFHVAATSGGVEVGSHDGRPLDAVVHADAVGILGLAAGGVGLRDAPGLRVDGDEAAVGAVFGL